MNSLKVQRNYMTKLCISKFKMMFMWVRSIQRGQFKEIENF